MSKSIGTNQDLRFIKIFVAIEFCLMAAVIVYGGLVYGVNSGKWEQSLMYSGGSFAGAFVMMVMIYQRAVERCKIFSR